MNAVSVLCVEVYGALVVGAGEAVASVGQAREVRQSTQSN